MLAPGRPSLGPALLALAALAVALLSRPAVREVTRPATPDMDGWTLTDLLRHLEGSGLHLHAAATSENGPVTRNAYLTRRERPRADLCALGTHPSRIGRWDGIVYCECGTSEAMEFNLPLWRECGLRAGPFLFFGDPEMLAQIRGALAVNP